MGPTVGVLCGVRLAAATSARHREPTPLTDVLTATRCALDDGPERHGMSSLVRRCLTFAHLVMSTNVHVATSACAVGVGDGVDPRADPCVESAGAVDGPGEHRAVVGGVDGVGEAGRVSARQVPGGGGLDQ